MTQRRLFALVLLIWPCAAAGGCSLVNSFGDVVSGTDGDVGGGGGEGGSSDVSIDQTTTDGPSTPRDSAPDGPVPEGGGVDATADGPLPIGDAGRDASDGAAPPQAGAVVVAGIQSGDGGFVLSVLDPSSGTELSRQPMTVVAVRHDPLRDLWYVFEDNGGIGAPSALPTDTVHLHVYTLQTSSGAWTQQATPLSVPPLVSPDSVTVLNGRLAYTAYAVGDAGWSGAYELVLVDTTSAANPRLISPATPLTDYPTGTIGTPKLSATGGTINLFHVDMSMCQADGSAQLCELEAVHVAVPSSGVPVVSATPVAITAVDPTASQGFASYVTGGPEDTIAFPPLGGASAYVELFSTATSIPFAGSTVSFLIADSHLQNVAISECFGMAFVVGVPNDTQVYGMPVAAGTNPVRPVDLGHAGQGVAFEPYTNTLIAPFKANGSFAISAYKLGGTAAAPTLSNRTTAGTWNPPADLEPNFVAVRPPIPFTSCPSP